MIKELHHVQITIPKGTEAEGRSFYCDLLGLKEIEKPDILKGRGGFWVQVGDVDLHIGTEDGIDRLSTKSHVAYQVSEISYWRNRLQEHGIEVIESIPLPNYDRFEFRDPFGNRVEMIQAL